MEQPFKILKQGRSKLVWGYYPSGRSWLHAVCVLCGKGCPLVFGKQGVGGSSTSVRSLLPLAVGSHIVSYVPTRVSPSSKNGWVCGSPRTAVVRDTCPSCSDRIRFFVQGVSAVYVGGRPKVAYPRVADMSEQYLHTQYMRFLIKHFPDKLHLYQEPK
jgi:hypothetical protein